MLKLAAFADEISPVLAEQIRVCVEHGVGDLELRGVEGKNVLDFDDAMCLRVRKAVTDAGLGVAVIASPLGKVAIDRPWAEQFDRFRRAVELAEIFGAKLIRIFSYYPVGGEGKGPVDGLRDEVVERFCQKCTYLEGRGIVMVHENERGIFGDNAARCADLLESVNSPALRAAFDFANFVQVGQEPMEAWHRLARFVAHIHVKDAVAATGKVVPAGEGDGRLGEILRLAYDAGYQGYLSLEPHLQVAGHSHGETGEALFGTAVEALRRVCRKAAIPLAAQQ